MCFTIPPPHLFENPYILYSFKVFHISDFTIVKEKNTTSLQEKRIITCQLSSKMEVL